jgi:hypothetical protein
MALSNACTVTQIITATVVNEIASGQIEFRGSGKTWKADRGDLLSAYQKFRVGRKADSDLSVVRYEPG